MSFQFDLRQNTILLTLAGSRLYGIHTPTSDVDLKGICVASKPYYTGFLNHFEQADAPEHIQNFIDLLTPEEQEVSKFQKVEGTIYEISKSFKLMADANPSMLDLIFADDRNIRLENSLGKLIRENRNLFLSTKAKFTYQGYSWQQFKRIKSHRHWILNPIVKQPTREEFGLPATSVISKDQLNAVFDAIKKQEDSWELDLSMIPSEIDRFNVQDKINNTIKEILAGDTKFQRAGRAINIDDNYLHILDQERKFRAAQTEWSQYQNWKKTRNPARAALECRYMYDTKHACHLVRLCRTCKEILLSGKVNVDRTGIDAEELLAIRNGAWTYEQLEEWFEREDKEISEIYARKDQILPRQPDLNALDKLCQQIIEQSLSL